MNVRRNNFVEIYSRADSVSGPLRSEETDMALGLATDRETGAANEGCAEAVREAAVFRVDVTPERGAVRV